MKHLDRAKVMGTPIYQVDAFTDKPFTGNPAAVCILEKARPASWMQDVAKEMNLSETGFVLPQKNGFSLRWFTPTREIDLCGHGTLASAHVLWEQGHLAKDQIARFLTQSGVLTAKKSKDGIELDFPAYSLQRIGAHPALRKSLGIKLDFAYDTGRDILVEFPNEKAVRDLKPDFAEMKKIPTLGIIVTARSRKNSQYDFVSRFFAPWIGIDEDPVTGSAHCALGPYWKKVMNKDEFMAYQASERGGSMKVRVSGERVYLTGQAVTVLHGRLTE